MKRTLAITLTVALIGSLMFMGFAGTAVAQEAPGNDDGDDGLDDGLIEIDDFFGDQTADQTTGDAAANTEINVNQNNDNAQVGVAEAEANAVAVDANDGTGTETLAAGAADDDKHYKDAGTAGVGQAADAGGTSAAAVANAEVNQAQDVTQQNNANVEGVTTIAESGDNELDQEQGFEVDVDVDADLGVDEGVGDDSGEE